MVLHQIEAQRQALIQKYASLGWVEAAQAGSSRRFTITPERCAVLARRLLRGWRCGASELGCILDLLKKFPEFVSGYQQQVVSASGEIIQDFELTISSPWCRKMELMHSSRGVAVDGAYQTNCLEYTVMGKAVVCPNGRGICTAVHISSSSETASSYKHFLRTSDAAVAADAVAAGEPRPPRPPYILDKSKGGTKAMEDDGLEYFYCTFHLKQAIDRKLIATTGVQQPTRERIMSDLDSLIYSKTQSAYAVAEAAFLQLPHVRAAAGFVEYFQDNWGGNGADKWAAYARGSRLTTTNHLECFWQLFEDTFLCDRVKSTVVELIRKVLLTVFPHQMREHAFARDGLRGTKQDRSRELHEHRVQQLTETAMTSIRACIPAIGLVEVSSSCSSSSGSAAASTKQSYFTCLSDATCSCPAAVRGTVCKHIEAAAEACCNAASNAASCSVSLAGQGKAAVDAAAEAGRVGAVMGLIVSGAEALLTQPLLRHKAVARVTGGAYTIVRFPSMLALLAIDGVGSTGSEAVVTELAGQAASRLVQPLKLHPLSTSSSAADTAAVVTSAARDLARLEELKARSVTMERPAAWGGEQPRALPMDEVSGTALLGRAGGDAAALAERLSSEDVSADKLRRIDAILEEGDPVEAAATQGLASGGPGGGETVLHGATETQGRALP
ncbi:hypothetical protein TSOC_006336 [Tetrabaena socialis]|uniref:SWIM-type domain-containing protein n=1 Tax=Tetrabaena socialis TaxID=47790 RepID=A0A2J8A420_9CHLO|nr:hypothetical protein TSOC_006336 [Tetrabaena socialis]|eukprot:PNH07248.1 hypothetical protein TSOC_006336 [Tetrabaena socialis]